jgi:hypothetical protein
VEKHKTSVRTVNVAAKTSHQVPPNYMSEALILADQFFVWENLSTEEKKEVGYKKS